MSLCCPVRASDSARPASTASCSAGLYRRLLCLRAALLSEPRSGHIRKQARGGAGKLNTCVGGGRRVGGRAAGGTQQQVQGVLHGQRMPGRQLPRRQAVAVRERQVQHQRLHCGRMRAHGQRRAARQGLRPFWKAPSAAGAGREALAHARACGPQHPGSCCTACPCAV